MFTARSGPGRRFGRVGTLRRRKRSGNGRRRGAQGAEGSSSSRKWKWRRGALIDSCLARCLLRLFPPSTAIINRRTSPLPWQGLCHPSPLEDAIPFGRRWIGVPLLPMRSVWTESLQREHSGVNRLNVNNSIFDIKKKRREKRKEVHRPSEQQERQLLLQCHGGRLSKKMVVEEKSFDDCKHHLKLCFAWMTRLTISTSSYTGTRLCTIVFFFSKITIVYKHRIHSYLNETVKVLSTCFL